MNAFVPGFALFAKLSFAFMNAFVPGFALFAKLIVSLVLIYFLAFYLITSVTYFVFIPCQVKLSQNHHYVGKNQYRAAIII